MMLHPLLMLAAACTSLAGVVSGHLPAALFVGALIVSGLVFERLIAGCRAASTYGDSAALAFPIFHTARDVAWAAAIVVWCARRVLSTPTHPAFSMHPRSSELQIADRELRIEIED